MHDRANQKLADAKLEDAMTAVLKRISEKGGTFEVRRGQNFDGRLRQILGLSYNRRFLYTVIVKLIVTKQLVRKNYVKVIYPISSQPLRGVKVRMASFSVVDE